ncbi:hypothetical protein FEV13_00645 (plasmid) [Stutzerimonas degradans]|nr:hypothetical protein FEV13_00645 [Stutzerimonas degradans]
MFSCSKIEQKQLNTWVSFQSAEQPLLGQFSVSGNRAASYRKGIREQFDQVRVLIEYMGRGRVVVP